MEKREFTTLRLTKATRDRLKERGFKGEDYDTVIARLLDTTESQNPRGTGP